MPTEEEFHTLMAELGRQDHFEAEQQQKRKAVGIEMSQIKNDPRWKVYEDHVLALVEGLDHSISDRQSQMRDDMSLSSEDILKLRTQIHGLVERHRGLKWALSIVDDLIVKGNITKGELDA